MASYLPHLMMSLVAYVLIACACLGLGRAGSWALGMGFRRSGRPFARIWLGWAIALLALQVWQLALPINLYATLSIYGVGLMLFLRHYPRFVVGHLRRKPKPGVILFALSLLVVASWIASHSITPGFPSRCRSL